MEFFCAYLDCYFKVYKRKTIILTQHVFRRSLLINDYLCIYNLNWESKFDISEMSN